MTQLVDVAVLLVAVAAHTAVHVPILNDPMPDDLSDVLKRQSDDLSEVLDGLSGNLADVLDDLKDEDLSDVLDGTHADSE